MKALFAAGLVSLAAAANAAMPVEVKRGNLEINIKATGTVVPDGVFRIKSPIEGRVESVLTSTFVWRGADQPLALLANRKLAAILDAKGTENADILEDRWRRFYPPTRARCPDACFVLKNFLKPKTWVKPESVMFEAAAALKLVGRVRPEDVHWIRDGQEIVFWAVKDPKRVLRGRVARLRLDIQGAKAEPGATFTLTLSPARYLDPGAEWEGRILALSKKGVLYVPTDALIRRGDDVYLPVRVSTGITTRGLTEVAAGIEEKRGALILDEAELHDAKRYDEEADLEARRRRARDLRDTQASVLDIGSDPVPAPDPPPDPSPDPVRRPSRRAPVIDGVDDTDYGEDPYAEPE